MIAKTIISAAAIAFVAGCASTAPTPTAANEQEVVYRPVEEE